MFKQYNFFQTNINQLKLIRNFIENSNWWDETI